jgi:NTP pyrophosphatase (non-canonical NTP hydrolase)
MTSSEYIKAVLATEPIDLPAIRERMVAHETVRGLHAVMGINTENGELQDAYKKYLFYGRELDRVNLLVELGDLLWYVGLLCNVLGVSLEQVMEINIAKLKLRYAGKFTETKANDRSLADERHLLEESL